MVSLILHLSLKVQNDDNRGQTGLSWKPTPAIAHQEVDISPAKSYQNVNKTQVKFIQLICT